MELEGGIGSNHNGRIIVSYVHQNGIVGRHGKIQFLKYFYSDRHVEASSYLEINDHDGETHFSRSAVFSINCLLKKTLELFILKS